MEGSTKLSVDRARWMGIDQETGETPLKQAGHLRPEEMRFGVRRLLPKPTSNQTVDRKYIITKNIRKDAKCLEIHHSECPDFFCGSPFLAASETGDTST